MLNKILENLKSEEEYVCYSDGLYSCTNKELYGYVSNIRSFLLRKNPDKKPVAVIGHKEIFVLASFLACSFAGMAYVPIDSSLPDGRVESILRQVEPDVVLNSSICDVMCKPAEHGICDILLNDDDVQYIIFTSGSTGEPKGVRILYRNLKSCVRWLEQLWNGTNGVVLNQANFSFDLSVADIYLSLVSKSTHFVLPKSVQSDYRQLFERLSLSGAQLAVFTPSFADYLLLDSSFSSALLPNLRSVIFCGESLGRRTVSRLMKAFPGLEIINCYGPTECTFAVTSVRVSDDAQADVPIGCPKDDTDIYIVDNELNILPDGQEGEIIITGASVGAGYVNPSLNANRFFELCGKPAYATGDIGVLADGYFYCLGRKDRQVKYKGYRIELQEIENVISSTDGCVNCRVCALKNSKGAVRRIFAFVQLRQGEDIKALENKLGNMLPEYMLPEIRVVDSIPLTANGKTDEKKLMECYI